LNTVQIDKEGQETPRSLYLLACEQFRKTAWIEAWVEANRWCSEPDPVSAYPGDNSLYDKARSILFMTEPQIRQMAQIP
jgi:hypothetical protein